MNRVLEGLQILAKYFHDGDFCAEHDVIYAGSDASDVEISEDDLNRLDELGWSIDEGLDSWYKFV